MSIIVKECKTQYQLKYALALAFLNSTTTSSAVGAAGEKQARMAQPAAGPNIQPTEKSTATRANEVRLSVPPNEIRAVGSKQLRVQ